MKVRGLDRARVDELVHSYDAVMRRAVKKTLAAVLDASVTTITAAGEETTFSAVDAVASIQAVWGTHVSEDLGPELAQLFFLAGVTIHGEVAKGASVDVTSSKMTLGNADVFLQTAVPRVNGFSAELWETAKTQVTLGLQDGESMKEIAQRIEDVAVIKAAKATVIAHTTAMAAINGGEYEQMRQLTATLGVTCTKQWEATEDSHTRPTHHAADGQVVNLDEPFHVGEASLAFPSDPTGPPNEVISCRCSTLYDIDVDDELQASGSLPLGNFDFSANVTFEGQSDGIYWHQEDHQTSPVTPSTVPAVATNGLTWDALTAAFKESDHPRGKNGRFIKKGVGLPAIALDLLKGLKGGSTFDDFLTSEKDTFVDDLVDITPKQWANLKSEDKKLFSDFAEEALENGIPGSAKAVSHIEELRGGDEDEDVDVFDPETTLPASTSAKSPAAKLLDYEKVAEPAVKHTQEWFDARAAAVKQASANRSDFYQQGDAEKEIAEFVSDWTGKSNQTHLKKKINTGSAYQGIINAAATGPNAPTLYRGFSLKSKGLVKGHQGFTGDPEKFIQGLVAGNELDLGKMASATESKEHAETFGDVTFAIKGAKGLPIESISNTPFEHEWLLTGKLKITGVQKKGKKYLVDTEWVGPESDTKTVDAPSVDASHEDEDEDVFDPDTELPDTEEPRLDAFLAKVDQAFSDGVLSEDDKDSILNELEEVGFESASEYFNELVPSASVPEVKVATVPTKKDVEQAIYDAHDTGQIDEDMQQNLLMILDKKGIDDATKALLNVTAPSTSTAAPTQLQKKIAKLVADDDTEGIWALGLGLTKQQWSHLSDEEKQDVFNALRSEQQADPDNADVEAAIKHVSKFDPKIQSEEEANEELLFPKGKPAKKSPFEILADTGDNGDGYAAPGLWGKYGAAGVLIAAPGGDGEPRFLMVQRGPMVSSNKGKWQLAGGALNSKESPEQGAAREIFEEIGAPQEYLTTMEKVGSHDIEVPIPGKKPWKYSNIVATAPTMFNPKIDGTETGDAKWLTKAEIDQLATTGQLHPALAKNLPQIFDVYDGKEKHTEAPAGKSAVGDVASPPVVTPAVSPTAPQSAPTPTTIAKATPVKMTHGLIHAKHTPGEVIAQTRVPAGTVKVKWDGKQYRVELYNKNGGFVAHTDVKKSALYAKLASDFPNAAWVKPGKQDVEVDTPSIATPSVPVTSVPSVTKPGEITPEAAFAMLDQYAPGELIGTWQYKKGSILKTSFEYRKAKDGSNAIVVYEMPAGFPEFKAIKKWDNPTDATSVGKVPAVQTLPSSFKHIPPKQGSGTPAVTSPLGNAPGPSAAKVSTGAGLDMTGWKQIEGQKGSNKGALFQAADGTKYYVKAQKTFDHAKNEVLAASLYALAGVKAPEIRHVTDGMPSGWSNVTASKIIDGKNIKLKLQTGAYTKQLIGEGFAVDAWLANWDVVGAVYDNIIEANGKPVRIDVGGSMLFRAQGSKKPFGVDVIELGTLKNPGINSQAAKVFGGLTSDQERESAKHLLGITDAQIDQQVKDAGLPQSLADTLKARRNNVLKAYGLDDQNVNTPPVINVPTPALVTSPSLTKEDYLKQWNKGLLTTAEYKLLTGEDPVISTSAPTTHASIDQLWNAVNGDLITKKYKPGDIVATGKSAKHPNAEYRLIIDENGVFAFQYKTPNFAWKTNDTPESFDKVNVEWTVNPPSPTNTAPSTPAAAVSTVPHLSEDVITYWPGVGGASYSPGQIIAHSIDGKWTLKKSDTPGSNFFWVVDGAGDIFATLDVGDVKKGEPLNITNGGEWIVPPSAPTPPTVTPSTASNVDWAALPTPASAPTPVTPTTPTHPTTGVGHLPMFKKVDFYNHFKDEKVSPAWSGAKIYNSIQVAKMKMAGDAQVAALTDEQMLDLVDEILKITPGGGKYAPGDQPYKAKVVDWLKTPNGKKAAIAAKSGGWASATATAPIGAKKTAKVTNAAKAAKKAAASGFVKKSIADIIGTASVNQVEGYTQQLRTKIYNAVKAQPTGNSVKSPPAELFASIHKVAKDNGLNESEVLMIMQLETTKKYGAVSHTYGATIGAWLNTPAGNKAAQEIQAGTYVPPVKAAKAAKKSSGTTYGSSYSGSFDFPANTPHSQKVALVGDQIEPFNASKSSGSFPVISTAQATTLWTDMQAQQGAVTVSQKASLKYYTSNTGYSAMNGYLRGKKGATQATQDHVNKAQEGMRRLTQDVMFHRGSGYFTGWGSYAEIKAREGTVWQEPAFFSASIGGKSAFGGSIAYIIEAPAGTPAAFVGMKGASNYVGEKEFFLAAGLKYQVISVENKGSSTTSGSSVTVRLRVVPDSEVAANVVASGSVK
jgi:8-oxo-dGTP pyrophosphatase MutT (NUDIX family)